MGVRVLYGDGGFVPDQPGLGEPKDHPWHLVRDAVEQIVAGRWSAYDSGRR